jgi:hypothetical protein
MAKTQREIQKAYRIRQKLKKSKMGINEKKAAENFKYRLVDVAGAIQKINQYGNKWPDRKYRDSITKEYYYSESYDRALNRLGPVSSYGPKGFMYAESGKDVVYVEGHMASRCFSQATS